MPTNDEMIKVAGNGKSIKEQAKELNLHASTWQNIRCGLVALKIIEQPRIAGFKSGWRPDWSRPHLFKCTRTKRGEAGAKITLGSVLREIGAVPGDLLRVEVTADKTTIVLRKAPPTAAESV